MVEFYPSISEELLNKALDFANQHTSEPISDADREIIMHSRRALLFTKNEAGQSVPWVKQSGTFDVTMGAPDGAEVCELVGLFLLSEIRSEFPELNCGLYRDDGMAEHRRIPGRRMEAIRQGLHELFRRHGLKITIEPPNKIIADFLDATFNMEEGTFKPYRKPNDQPIYVHRKSNHPPNVLEQIPKSINKRLVNISSSKEVFDAAVPDYQKALTESGYSHKLEFVTPTAKKKRSRCRDILWFNPPYNMAVTTNIGASFLRLIDQHFPKTDPLHKIVNRNTVKVSYSCMKNIKSIIDSHNKKLLHEEKRVEPTKPCNCQRSRRERCPMKGKCVQKDVIYHAEVKGGGEVRKYVGSTVNFKRRHYGHTSSFRHEGKKHSTALSTHVWEKDLGPDPDIEWSVLAHAPSYRLGQRNCDLCLTEKTEIAKNFNNPQYLNKRGEIAQKCRHKRCYLLQPPKKGEREDL